VATKISAERPEHSQQIPGNFSTLTSEKCFFGHFMDVFWFKA
jgi:hypothetical protein